MIDLVVRPDARKRNIQRCRERGILLPTFRQMRDPDLVPQSIKDRLRGIGLWDVDPANLFRITWHNEPKETGGGFGKVNTVWFPPELTGVKADIVGLVGKWFPTGAHKVGATYGCLAPALAAGSFDATEQKAVWPSTGNYCRGGAYNSALLGCDSIAILPEEMSRERFDWLSGIAGEVIATPGSESNVKEIFDACHDLSRDRGDNIMIFNQFEEFGNYLWHYWVTGTAIEEALGVSIGDGRDFRGYVSATGSGGTLAAGDYLKTVFPAIKLAAAEALQCPTLLQNGFGAHRIEGIGDKHVPWIHNVKNTDIVAGIDDGDCMNLLRLFNEPAGQDLLVSNGVPESVVADLPLLGISGIGNLLASIKLARYYELGEGEVVATILTDSMDLYGSRLLEMREMFGAFTREKAVEVLSGSLSSQRIDNVMELSYYDRKRVHNLKYFTWVEQQGRTMEELNAQWDDADYWRRIPELAAGIDELIESFNRDVTGGSEGDHPLLLRELRGSVRWRPAGVPVSVLCARLRDAGSGGFRKGNLIVQTPKPAAAVSGRPVDPYWFLPFPAAHYRAYPVGNTALVAPEVLRNETGFRRLFFKNDALNPSGSLKDRASLLVAEQALRLGEERVVLASTGNAGSAMACAGAAYSLDVVLFVPDSAPRAKLLQALLYGARLVPIRGSYDEAFSLSIEYSRRHGGVNRNTGFNPFTVEGKKTVAIEIYNQLGCRRPDVVYVPTGDGVIFSAVHKGFVDLLEAGLIEKPPLLVMVQAEGSNALSRSWRDCREVVLDRADTAADSISVASPANGVMALKYLREGGGRVVEVSDGDILAAQLELANKGGLFVEPSSAAAWAGFLQDRASVDQNSSVVVLLTGTGFKDLGSVEDSVNIPPSLPPDLDEVSAFLK